MNERDEEHVVRTLLRRADRPLQPPPFRSTQHRRRREFGGGVVAAAAGAVMLGLVVGVGLANLRASSPGTSALQPGTPTPSPTVATGTAAALGRTAEAGVVLFIDGPDLWRYDGAGGAVARIGSAAGVRMTGDGRRMVLPTGELIDARSGDSWKFSGGGSVSADAAPSGERVAYIDARRQLHVVVRGQSPQRMLAHLEFVNVHWSPMGDVLALERAPLPGTTRFAPESAWPQIPSELWLLSLATGDTRRIYVPTATADGGLATFRFGSWSPDGRYVAIWEIQTVSGSLDQDGRPLFLVDIRSGERIGLGTTLLYPDWLAWRAPNTLAFVAGRGRETWRGKTLRLWDPRSGTRDVTAPSDVGLAPTWTPNGELWFLRAPSGDYVLADFFGGTGIGARRLAVLRTDGTTALLPQPGDEMHVVEAARPAGSGDRALLVIRTLGVTRDHIELWLGRMDGGRPTPLVRLRVEGFGFYGRFPTPFQMAWSE